MVGRVLEKVRKIVFHGASIKHVSAHLLNAGVGDTSRNRDATEQRGTPVELVGGAVARDYVAPGILRAAKAQRFKQIA
jgi:hypothetical protein